MASQHGSRKTYFSPHLRRKPVFQEVFQEQNLQPQSGYEITGHQSTQRQSMRSQSLQGQDGGRQSKQHQPVKDQPTQQQPDQRRFIQQPFTQQPVQRQFVQKQSARGHELQPVARQATSQNLEELLGPSQLKTMNEIEEEEKVPKQTQSLGQDIWDWIFGKSNAEKKPKAPVPVITINGKPVI